MNSLTHRLLNCIVQQSHELNIQSSRVCTSAKWLFPRNAVHVNRTQLTLFGSHNLWPQEKEKNTHILRCDHCHLFRYHKNLWPCLRNNVSPRKAHSEKKKKPTIIINDTHRPCCWLLPFAEQLLRSLSLSLSVRLLQGKHAIHRCIVLRLQLSITESIRFSFTSFFASIVSSAHIIQLSAIISPFVANWSHTIHQAPVFVQSLSLGLYELRVGTVSLHLQSIHTLQFASDLLIE